MRISYNPAWTTLLQNNQNNRQSLPVQNTLPPIPVCQKQISFTGLLNIFKKKTPIEKLQQLADDAHLYFRPLEIAILRNDYKGVIKKEDIITILEKEKDKANMHGAKERFERLINVVKKYEP